LHWPRPGLAIGSHKVHPFAGAANDRHFIEGGRKLTKQPVTATNQTRAWPFLGLLAILGHIVNTIGGFSYLQDFPELLQGHALDLMSNSADVFPTTVTVIFPEILCSFLAMLLVALISGMHKGEHAVAAARANGSRCPGPT
jgi:hypothetical protein